jgi:cytochrome c oxidase subunit II
MSLFGTLLASQGQDATFWFPGQHSTVAKDVDWLYFYIYWLCLFFFFLIMIAAALFVVKYRHKPGGPKADHTFIHSTKLELFWSVIPGMFLIPMFYWGFTGYVDMRTPPAGAYEVRVTAMKWQWNFIYPNGVISDRLLVPANQPIKLTMSSADVIHSLFIPSFRVKQDVVPGRYTSLWFEANKEGEYNLFCTEYCGTKHSDMITKCIVVSAANFPTELDLLDQKKPEQSEADWGKEQFAKFGCAQCHPVTGDKDAIGPRLNISGSEHGFGTTRKLVAGPDQLMDENYIRESIVNPMAKVRAGFNPVMPSYQGRAKDKHINAIIEYLKTLK